LKKWISFSTLIGVFSTALLILITTGSRASVIFDYEGMGIGLTDGAAGNISNYMTNLYGSQVTVTEALNWNNTLAGPDWNNPLNETNHLRLGVSFNDFEISFDNVPITSIIMGFKVYVFDDTGPVDFRIAAFNSNFMVDGGTRENPNPGALVFTRTFNPGSGQQLLLNSTLVFSEPVTLLVFTDSGTSDIGIDDLQVSPIPEPSTYLLFAIGILGIIGMGYRQRKKAT